MASFNKFESFVGVLGTGDHHLDSGGDTIKVYLSNAAPSASDDNVKADLAEITMTNETNHGAGGGDIQNDYSEAAGVGTLTGTDVVFEASGGTVGPFRYAVLYNDTHGSDALIGWWDYGSEVTLNDGETFTVDFGASILTVE
jgi:hypothetical protein